jgi:hypothetical protein
LSEFISLIAGPILTIHSIVAVHGHVGNALTTWQHENGKIWLWDFLPQDLPGIRVLTFGYDIRPFFQRSDSESNRSETRFMPVAEALCSDLSDERLNVSIVSANNVKLKRPSAGQFPHNLHRAWLRRTCGEKRPYSIPQCVFQV